MTSFVYAADLHLKRQNWATRPDIVDDAYYTYQQLIRHCVARHCNLVLGGDIFDSPRPASQDIQIFREGLDTLIAAGLQVFVTQGQHDRSVPPWPAAVVGRGVWYVHGMVFTPVAEQPQVKAFALDNMSRDELQARLATDPETTASIYVLHQLAKPVFTFEDKWDFDPAWLPPNVKLALMGDLHKQVEFRAGNAVGYYPGSTHATELPEAEAGGFSFLEVDVLTLGVTRVPLQTRPYWFYTVNTEEQLSALATTVFQRLEAHVIAATPASMAERVLRPVIVVDYLAGIQGVESKFKDAIRGRAGFWPRPITLRMDTVVDRQRSPDGVDAVVPTLAACLEDIEVSDRAKGLVLDLLVRPSKIVFTELRSEFGVEATATAPV